MAMQANKALVDVMGTFPEGEGERADSPDLDEVEVEPDGESATTHLEHSMESLAVFQKVDEKATVCMMKFFFKNNAESNKE